MKNHKSSKKIICDFTITDYEKNLYELLRKIEKIMSSENLISRDINEITASLITNDGEMTLESVVKILSLIYEKKPGEKFFYSTICGQRLAFNHLRIIIQISFF